MGRKNYDNEKANEERKVVSIFTVVSLVVLFGALLIAILLS